jgi:hypothetical protein
MLHAACVAAEVACCRRAVHTCPTARVLLLQATLQVQCSAQPNLNSTVQKCECCLFCECSASKRTRAKRSCCSVPQGVQHSNVYETHICVDENQVRFSHYGNHTHQLGIMNSPHDGTSTSKGYDRVCVACESLSDSNTSVLIVPI